MLCCVMFVVLFSIIALYASILEKLINSPFNSYSICFPVSFNNDFNKSGLFFKDSLNCINNDETPVTNGTEIDVPETNSSPP